MSLYVVSTVTAKAATYNLVTLAAVKSELDITTTTDDAWLTSGIAQISKAIRKYCNRAFNVERLTDTFYFDKAPRARDIPGSGDALQLSRFPVISVASVTILTLPNTTETLTAGTDFVIDYENGRLLRLRSTTGTMTSWRDVQVTVDYIAGQGAVTSENYSIPADPGPYTQAVANAANFSIDQGVTFTGGAALVPITGGTPATGQYLCNTLTGIYTFAAADAGKAITITYGFNQIEEDLADATLRQMTARYKAWDRDPMLMQRDQPSTGSERFWVGAQQGQTGAFPPEVAALLDNYRVPVVA